MQANRIEPIGESEYAEVVDVWEASVRHTHDFLSEADIAHYRPLVLQHFLSAVDLWGAKATSEAILGFVGVADGNIEMLFVSPEAMGQGHGRRLLEHAVRNLGATRVDVNEQNPAALGFYEHCGFRVVGRSPTDGQGQPFPLLHLELGPST